MTGDLASDIPAFAQCCLSIFASCKQAAWIELKCVQVDWIARIRSDWEADVSDSGCQCHVQCKDAENIHGNVQGILSLTPIANEQAPQAFCAADCMHQIIGQHDQTRLREHILAVMQSVSCLPSCSRVDTPADACSFIQWNALIKCADAEADKL